MLTDAELRLMEVVWRIGTAKVSDVMDALPPPRYIVLEQLDCAYLDRASSTATRPPTRRSATW